MRNQRLWLIFLATAGILECGMALAHFGLQYEWAGFDFGDLPAQLAWALLALNFSWGVLLLAIGVLVVHVALHSGIAPTGVSGLAPTRFGVAPARFGIALTIVRETAPTETPRNTPVRRPG